MSTYNKERHKELVRRCLDFQNQGTSLFRENFKEDFELTEYDGAVSEQVYWSHREEFIPIIKNFLTNNIDFDKFDGNFSVVYQKATREYFLLRRDLKQIEKFEPSTRPDSFNTPMNVIFQIFETVEDGYRSKQEAMVYIKETCLRYQIFKDGIDIWI